MGTVSAGGIIARENLETVKLVVTGGAGFIGSAMVWKANTEGVDEILIVDELGTGEKWQNLPALRFTDFMHKTEFLRRVQKGDALPFVPDAVVHMGACSATTERDADFLMENNTHYTHALAEYCVSRGIRFVYASSGATYGNGESGFDDAPEKMPTLRPLNMYGYSKHLFDIQAQKSGLLNQIVGLKFFNVFGPNEYDKGAMTSVVLNAFRQIQSTGTVSLFESYRSDYANGQQVRDFVYVKDAVNVMWWLLQNPGVCGVYNVGTGTARTWNDLARATFAACSKPEKIDYIPMPEVLRGKYQYHTEAKMDRLRAAGCDFSFYRLEEAVSDYVQNYLLPGDLRLGQTV